MLISLRNMQGGTKLCTVLSVGRGAQACAESWRADGSLVGYSPWGHKESDRTERQARMHVLNDYHMPFLILIKTGHLF